MRMKMQNTNRVSMQKQVYQEIKNAILRAELQPGQSLSEQELASQWSVSRTPVRESLISLSHDGLVNIYPQRGTVVSYINKENVIQAQFIRESLEVEVIRKLVKVISPEHLLKLQQNIDMQKLMLNNQDYDGFYELDEEFHREMTIFCGYPRVWEVIKREKIQLDRVRLLSLPNDSLIKKLISQHQQIVNHLKAKDTDKLVIAVREHTQRVLSSLEKISKEKEQYFV